MQNNTKNVYNTYVNMETCKKDIYNNNKNKTGVYCIEHKKSKEKYLGSANDICNRMRWYYSKTSLLKYLKRSNSLIANALIRYGYSEFKFRILGYCDSNIRFHRKQYYINLIKQVVRIKKYKK